MGANPSSTVMLLLPQTNLDLEDSTNPDLVKASVSLSTLFPRKPPISL